jgi:hypothetical protein
MRIGLVHWTLPIGPRKAVVRDRRQWVKCGLITERPPRAFLKTRGESDSPRTPLRTAMRSRRSRAVAGHSAGRDPLIGRCS